MNQDIKYCPTREVQTPEEVAQEYIAAMKYHVDERFLNQDFLSIIYQEVLDYMRDKGVN